MNTVIKDLKAVWKTFIGKVIIILAAAASGGLGYVTDIFTDWTTGAQSAIEQRVETTEQ